MENTSLQNLETWTQNHWIKCQYYCNTDQLFECTVYPYITSNCLAALFWKHPNFGFEFIQQVPMILFFSYFPIISGFNISNHVIGHWPIRIFWFQHHTCLTICTYIKTEVQHSMYVIWFHHATNAYLNDVLLYYNNRRLFHAARQPARCHWHASNKLLEVINVNNISQKISMKLYLLGKIWIPIGVMWHIFFIMASLAQREPHENPPASHVNPTEYA